MLITEKKEDTNNIRNKKGNKARDIIDTKMIIRDYYKKIHGNNFGKIPRNIKLTETQQ